MNISNEMREKLADAQIEYVLRILKIADKYGMNRSDVLRIATKSIFDSTQIVTFQNTDLSDEANDLKHEINSEQEATQSLKQKIFRR